MERKPRIFIGSSVESLPVADAVNINLDHQAEVTIWRNGTFELAGNTIDSLERKAQSVDFSIFIFSPDDIAIIRQQEKVVVRDNVVFELGLFIGALGKERCFILKPRGIDLHLPTDLLGMTPADYEPNRSDGDLASAVNHACVLIKKQMEKFSLREKSQSVRMHPDNASNISSELNAIDFSVLEELVETYTSSPGGIRMRWIKENLTRLYNDIEPYQIGISAIRLEKIGYIDKMNEEDRDGDQYYVYSITSSGIDILLDRENNTSMPKNLKRKEVNHSERSDVPF